MKFKDLCNGDEFITYKYRYLCTKINESTAKTKSGTTPFDADTIVQRIMRPNL